RAKRAADTEFPAVFAAQVLGGWDRRSADRIALRAATPHDIPGKIPPWPPRQQRATTASYYIRRRTDRRFNHGGRIFEAIRPPLHLPRRSRPLHPRRSSPALPEYDPRRGGKTTETAHSES